MNLTGFVDLHTHGLGRYDTRTTSTQQLIGLAGLHGGAGTAAILPTIYPAPIAIMRQQLEAVRRAMELQSAAGGSVTAGSAKILGAHLEGPFLNPLRCGALDARSFLRPSLRHLEQLLAGYEDIVKVITVAPELPSALSVISRCRTLGLRVNMGHSDATYTQALAGKKEGATGVTHLFNAMRPFHHREPGLSGLALQDEDLYVEVIADAVHLHPQTLALIFGTKRIDRIILITDSVKGGRGKAVYKGKGVLAGSGISLEASIPVLRAVGIPDAEILEAALDNPLRYLGLRAVPA